MESPNCCGFLMGILDLLIKLVFAQSYTLFWCFLLMFCASRLLFFGFICNVGFDTPIALGPELSLILVIFAEVFCAAFVITGLWTRPALIALIINMVVITFIAHADDPFSSKELPLFFLVAWIPLFLSGPGKYSLDQRLFNKEKDTISQ